PPSAWRRSRRRFPSWSCSGGGRAFAESRGPGAASSPASSRRSFSIRSPSSHRFSPLLVRPPSDLLFHNPLTLFSSSLSFSSSSSLQSSVPSVTSLLIFFFPLITLLIFSLHLLFFCFSWPSPGTLLPLQPPLSPLSNFFVVEREGAGGALHPRCQGRARAPR